MPSAVVGALRVNLGVDSSEFDKGLDKGQRKLGAFEKAATASLGRVGDVFKNFGAGLVGGLAAGGLMGALSTVRELARGVASVGDEAKRAGLSTKAFQELKYVAEQSRVGVDALVDGMKELALRADEFIVTGQGSAAEAFKRLGYSAQDLKAKLRDPSALFTEIIGKMEKLDKAAQIRIADELFGGTGGEQFVQLLDQGEKKIRAQIKAANDLGLVMSDELIAKAAELDAKFNQVVSTVGTALKTAVVEAAHAMATFADEFREWNSTYQQRRGAAEAGARIGGMVGAGVDPTLIEYRDNIRASIARLNTMRSSAARIGREADDERQLSLLQSQLNVVEERIAAQQRLNSEKREELALDEVVVEREWRESSGGRTRFRQYGEIDLPGAVDATPERRVDPYFGPPTEADQARKAGEDMAVAFIKKFEGYRSSAYWDVNAYRAGFGSDTTTREDGRVVKINANSVVTLADSNRDLARRIGEFQSIIKRQIGADTFASFTEEQLAALTSIAYNYGSLPDRIVDAIRTGNSTVTGNAIANLSGDNNGINRKRRLEEADLFNSNSSSDYLTIVEERTARVRDANDQLQSSYDQLGQIGVSAVQGIANALADGKIEGREMLQIVMSLIEQIMSMPAAKDGFGNLLGAIFGGGGGKSCIPSLTSPSFKPNTTFAGFLGIPGFANGGEFRVGGAGGIDSQLVAFRASPNEHVSITKPGQMMSPGPSISMQVDARGSTMTESQWRRIADQSARTALAQYHDDQVNGGFGEVQRRYASQKG